MPELKIRADHSSGKWENFPAGLRVLVVDDDSLCLKVIAQMLRSCKYEGAGRGDGCRARGLVDVASLRAASVSLWLVSDKSFVRMLPCSHDVHELRESAGPAARPQEIFRPGAVGRVHARYGSLSGPVRRRGGT